ncbi:MAG: DUF2007 domain-containing protein [Candidatus Poribacteria bacterium]|nr:DUF2007 domain-containing protein [Candidatus Poribacteria bacterium]MDE0506726.1 DUF2007 domain-containing protein [Candidatus Poribacteria bacterium]
MDEKLVTVSTFDMPTEAHLAKGLLEANGLTAFLADELTVGVAWHLSNAIGGIKLQVVETDVERAASILEAREDPSIDSEDKIANFPAEESESQSYSSEADKTVDRAVRAALLGLILLPLQLYSLWLLGRLAFSRQNIITRKRRRIYLAVVLNLPMLVFLSVGIQWLLQRF